ncbi:UDP-diphosphatase [Candidatus Pacearchaeota archaeon]|nr:UDP-diphosphatase [Candidatus Pacearchaeota archaeon]|tara:strand:- start:4150 stop:4875 length:726 start_codon:yes stop_codon:yes gene_type:complete
MQNEILLAIIQAATEFLPISSSGHLALMSNIISTPNLFLITTLHLASLLAVLIFTRKEIYDIITLKEKKLTLYLIIATIPAIIFGLTFKPLIETALNSYLALGIAFIFTGFILLSTKSKKQKQKLNSKSALTIGLFQMLALFPGVSRSGMTISLALITGIEKQKAAKFSFLLFIPLAIGAFILEFGEAYFSIELAIAFILCFALSLIFLNALTYIIKRNKFWLFSIYCWLIGIITLTIYFL